MHTRTTLALAALATLLPACAPDDLEFRSTTFGCSSCGGNSNSAHANLYPIADNNEGGLPNSGGVVVMGIESPTHHKYKLRTVGDELVAWDPVADAVAAQGTALIGWDIIFYVAEKSMEIPVRIFGYDPSVPSWASGAAPISGYALAWQDPEVAGEWYSVCPDHTADSIAVTIVGDELYDEETKEVIPAPDWFTIACFGNAVAKMKLFSYGPNQLVDGAKTAPIVERQATLRMVTADYCGTGLSFTADGTPLGWKNSYGTVNAGLQMFTSLEALWDKSGAICLNRPRLAKSTEVAEHCTVPTCSLAMLNGGDWDWATWKQ